MIFRQVQVQNVSKRHRFSVFCGSKDFYWGARLKVLVMSLPDVFFYVHHCCRSDIRTGFKMKVLTSFQPLQMPNRCLLLVQNQTFDDIILWLQQGWIEPSTSEYGTDALPSKLQKHLSFGFSSSISPSSKLRCWDLQFLWIQHDSEFFFLALYIGISIGPKIHVGLHKNKNKK